MPHFENFGQGQRPGLFDVIRNPSAWYGETYTNGEYTEKRAVCVANHTRGVLGFMLLQILWPFVEPSSSVLDHIQFGLGTLTQSQRRS